jgi:hypothetical protein
MLCLVNAVVSMGRRNFKTVIRIRSSVAVTSLKRAADRSVLNMGRAFQPLSISASALVTYSSLFLFCAMRCSYLSSSKNPKTLCLRHPVRGGWLRPQVRDLCRLCFLVCRNVRLSLRSMSSRSGRRRSVMKRLVFAPPLVYISSYEKAMVDHSPCSRSGLPDSLSRRKSS